jgi:DNA repair exonuclease SbcCD ATPase subunit
MIWGHRQKFDRITEMKIGPFRGFATNESFTFDKKYTFMYGPNGSGKSSFCEGLEYALLGGIEEADAKRIPESF